jgi:hypothetical protein
VSDKLKRADEPEAYPVARCRTCGAQGVTIGKASKHLFVHRVGADMTAPFCDDSDLGQFPLDYSRDIAAWMERERVTAAAAKAQLDGR